jgi:hypothetical protein
MSHTRRVQPAMTAGRTAAAWAAGLDGPDDYRLPVET